MKNFDISVIICTHNPKQELLSKVLQALELQTLPLHCWELLLIDNASSEEFISSFNLNWHPNSRCIQEEKLGLTHARVCGILAAKASLLVFVDDDNVLDTKYLEVALEISKKYPRLGTWGGQTLPGFEEEPPAWTKRYWTRVGVREFEENYLSYSAESSFTPIGAGMCVRRTVATGYADLVSKDFRRSKLLGRKGDTLLGCEDLDLAWTSNDLGLGSGVFTSLKLVHLIPKHRLEESYLLKVVQGSDYSEVVLRFLRNGKITWKQKLRFWMPWLTPPKLWFTNAQEKRFYQAGARGRYLALKDILRNKFASELTEIKI